MTDRKHTFQSKAQAPAVRRLVPIGNPAKPDEEIKLERQGNQSQSQDHLNIDLLNRLIKHLKAL